MIFKKKYKKVKLVSSETGKKIDVIKFPIEEFNLILNACKYQNITVEQFFKQCLEDLIYGDSYKQRYKQIGEKT